jgi:hypothetical protein
MRVIKLRRMRGEGHVARMVELPNAYAVLVSNRKRRDHWVTMRPCDSGLESIGGLMWTREWTVRFHKSGPSNRLSASQDGFLHEVNLWYERGIVRSELERAWKDAAMAGILVAQHHQKPHDIRGVVRDSKWGTSDIVLANLFLKGDLLTQCCDHLVTDDVVSIFVSMFKWSRFLFKSHGQSNEEPVYRETRWHAQMHVVQMQEAISACHDTFVCFVPVKGMFTVASLGTLPCELVSKWKELRFTHGE